MMTFSLADIHRFLRRFSQKLQRKSAIFNLHQSARNKPNNNKYYMKKLKHIYLLLFLLSIFNLNGMTQTTNQQKTGILLVSFGTSYSDAQQALDNIEEEVRKTFPGTEVRWAFTSNIIRKKLKKQGQAIDSPAEALAHYTADGYTCIAVQSLHVIPGEEYENLQKTVVAFNQMPKNAEAVLIGKPLLYQHAGINSVVDVISKILPQDLKKGEAVLMMGHGTHHPSNIYYPGVQYYLSQKNPSYFLATVEGYPGLTEVLPQLKEQKIKTIWLMPFMSVAGDHVQNDMAGDEPESWKSQLEARGYEVNVMMKGLAEYDEIVAIWINHLKEIMHELEK